jgi:predicted CXXCH cytochrome family protein
MIRRAAALLLGIAIPGAALAGPPEDPYRLKPGAKGTLCLECHVVFQEKARLPHVHTPVKAGECTRCHNPHASTHGQLLAAEPGEICATCHAGIVPPKPRSVHAPVASGECARCHDPHASRNRNVLTTPGNDLCATCHAEVAARAVRAKFQHDPVGKSCLTCHDPHASRGSPSLLKKEEPALCIGCHRTDQAAFAARHQNYPVAKGRCTACHDPHGSESSAMLRASVHAPIPNKMCNQCHFDASSPNALATRRQGVELCRACHSPMIGETLAKNRVHWAAVEGTGCLVCHAPHASSEPALLRLPAKPLCATCHADTMERQERSAVKHPPAEEGNCAACHSPHASDQVFLLAEADLGTQCGACHEWREHSSHPIGEKFADPRNRNLRLDCLSCHRTHGTPFKALAHFDTGADLCVQCHQQVGR